MTKDQNELATAMEIAVRNERFSDAAIWLNGHTLDLSEPREYRIFEMAMQHPPVAEKVRMLIRAAQKADNSQEKMTDERALRECQEAQRVWIDAGKELKREAA